MNSYIRLLRNKTTRMWVESDKKIHAFNYWYYRYLTNKYTDYLLRLYDKAISDGVTKVNTKETER